MSDLTYGPPRRLKVGHLVTGLVFLGLAGSWALSASGAVDGVTVAWLLPAILVGAGVVGLLAMLASGVRRGRPGATTEHDQDDTHDTHETDQSDDGSGFDDPDDTRTLPEEDHR